MTHVHLPTVPPTLDAAALTELIRRAADSDDPFPYASIEVDGWRVQVMRTFNDYKVRLNDSWTFQISSPAETPGNRWEAARDKKDPPRSQDESEHDDPDDEDVANVVDMAIVRILRDGDTR